MAKILENFSKNLLRQNSVPIPSGMVVSSPDEIDQITQSINPPWMVKALVPMGKKGKAGLIQKAEDENEAKNLVNSLIGKEVNKLKVEQVLIEECISIKKELFISITYDNLARSPVILFSPQGGIDVEELLKKHPDQLYSHGIDILEGFHAFQARELCFKAGLNKDETAKVAPIMVALYEMFFRLLEINPLVITDNGDVCAVGALLNVDDDALYRHPELEGMAQFGEDRSLANLTERERKVLEADRAYPGSGAVRYTEFDGGNVAVAVIGGGASLVVMDSIYKSGARPANYSDVGPGKGLEAKFKVLMQEALSKPGIEALFIGAAVIVAVDITDIAKIIKQVLKDINFESMNIPVIARWAGLGDKEAKAEIMSIPNCRYFGRETTIEEAAEMLAELV
jgi:succinyl-CoA synthetase beta subunit/citryl-CoA synthetase large subunit